MEKLRIPEIDLVVCDLFQSLHSIATFNNDDCVEQTCNACIR